MRYNPFRDYDKHGCLKLPWTLYISLAYLLKGYVIWIVSLSYRENPVALLNIFYPNHNDFYHSLIIGLPAVISLGVVSFRRVKVLTILAWSWSNIRWLLCFSGGIQVVNSIWQGHVSWHEIQFAASNIWVLTDFFVTCMIVIYVILNQHVKDITSEYLDIEVSNNKKKNSDLNNQSL